MADRGPTSPPLVLVAACLLAALLAAACDSPRRQAERHLAAGDVHLREGRPDAALAEYQQALAVVPDHLPARLRLAGVHLAQGRPEPAREAVEWVLGRDPQNAAAYLLWGSVLVREDRLSEAAEKYRAAAELAPQWSQAHYEWAGALAHLGEDEAAIARFEIASGLDPQLPPDALALWGRALARQGRTREARERYEAVLAAAPHHVMALDGLGMLVLRHGGGPAAAIPWLERAAAERPDDPGLLHHLGAACLEAERYGEAHNLLQRAVATTSEDDPAYPERRRLLAAARAELPAAAAGPQMPNVLLILLDTVRADHLGCYGYFRDTSPEIDGLARAGVVFENAVSQAPWTAAAVASLFSGLYPSVHGIDRELQFREQVGDGAMPFVVQRVLPPSRLTLAEHFRRHGYRTAGFVANAFLHSIFGFAHGFSTWDDDHRDYAGDDRTRKRRAAETHRRVFRWLEQDLSEPFFLLVHYNDPHWPYDPPPPFGAEYVAGYEGPLEASQTGFLVERQGRPIDGLRPEDVAFLRGLYDGEIRYADHHVGLLLARLRELGLERDLLTVVVSDHGEEFLDHGAASHGYTLYEEQTHVPLILHWPGRLPAVRIAAQVRLIDLLPTLAELAGLAAPSEVVQGRSLVPLVAATAPAAERDAFSEGTYLRRQRALRTAGGLKLILSDERALLFDLARDPGEQHDLAAGNHPALPALRERMEQWTAANRAVREQLFGAGPFAEVVVDDEVQERLRALGYLQ